MSLQPADTSDEPVEGSGQVSRRGFLRAAGVVGLTGMAATLAACQAATTPQWSFGAPATPGTAPTAAPSVAATAAATAAPSVAPSPSAAASPSAPASVAPSAAPSASAPANIPAGWTAHDVAARDVVRRYVGNLAPALKDIYGDAASAKMGEILGVSDGYPQLTQKPAFVQVPNLFVTDLTAPLKPTMDGDTKVFDMTIDAFDWQIDELKAPVKAVGYNKQWPGPTITVNEGDKLRFNFTNNLTETSSVHFHGEEFADFFQDGVPFVTQVPIPPGQTYTYQFAASRPGSLMYHSHHNATDQVGRGLLGAYVVKPAKPTADEKAVNGVDYVWISNDSLGGFTINGHGFPATVPVLAALGQTVRIRFMNEGTMMHPWHLHGNRMKVIARDGYNLPQPFYADTLGVNPGERYDVTVKANSLGIWAFHCHILPHVEGADGMFGMVNTLIVVPKPEHITAILNLLTA
jgi:FtsP/CotA-like multicopper oxidase with cupredoxin domain